MVEANITYATYPSNSNTEEEIRNKCQETGDEIHCLTVSVSKDISEPSIEDIYTTLVPIGCKVQCLVIRYETTPERSLVNASSVLEKVESVHMITPVVTKDDVSRLNDIIKSGGDFKIRITGFVGDHKLDIPTKIAGGDYVTIEICDDTITVVSEPNLEKMSKPLDSFDDELVRLDEKDSLDYISQNSSNR